MHRKSHRVSDHVGGELGPSSGHLVLACCTHKIKSYKFSIVREDVKQFKRLHKVDKFCVQNSLGGLDFGGSPAMVEP